MAQPTIETLLDPRYTDVVLEEQVNAASYNSRDIVTITHANTVTLKQGTVLWRTKGADATAVWDVVDAAGDISVNNEYAVLIGDEFEPAETVDVTAATPRQAIALVRYARVKEFPLKAIHVTGYSISEANFNNLKRLMAKDLILVDGSLTAIAP